MPLAREDVARRILTMPADQQRMAAALALKIYGDPPGERSVAGRDPRERRKYVGDPFAYFSDILGARLTAQQEEALELLERETRVLIPSANNQGKTFLLAGYGIYIMDALAAVPDEEQGLEEQGARLLLPGPDHSTIYATIYSEMLTLAARAERRGHLMPGRRSENSVLWRVRSQWEVEAFSPPKKVEQEVAHTASGRHHRNQVALIEEGQGVKESVWKAAEGMCSSAGNKIASSFNPTEPLGPAFQRARSGGYVCLHLSAFDHPNVMRRMPIVPAAVDFKVIDARVRTECRDRGAHPQTSVEPDRGDFLYALPPKGAEERGHRKDGVLGHPEGEVRVYRPTPAFTAQVLGRWPESSDTHLFDPGAWDEAVQRWRAEPDPTSPPDRVGVDVAREGDDETCTAPAWGDPAESLLRAYVETQDQIATGALLEIAMDQLYERRARVGELRVMPKGDGHDTGEAIYAAFGDVPYNVDITGVGTSPLDYLRRILECDAEGISFAALPPDPFRVGFLPWCENVRTWMYVTAAKLVKLGLVDVPPDPLLREEVMAHWLNTKSRTVELYDERRGRLEKKRVPSMLLGRKEEVRKRIGHSPDRSDAFVLSLFDALSTSEKRKRKVKLAWGGARR
jgi:hypothetical protein